MKILINETKELKTISILSDKGINYIQDFIFNNYDPGFEYNEDEDLYTTSQENYDWWERVVDAHQKTNDRLSALPKDEETSETVLWQVLQQADPDLELWPDDVNNRLDNLGL